MRLIKYVVLLVLFGGGYILADYANPPGWESYRYFTHQSWDFSADKSNNLPALPDGDPCWFNHYGQPFLTAIGYSTGAMYWQWEYHGDVPTDRRGYYGGMGNTTLTFLVPRKSLGGLWQNQIWFQAAYWARNDGGQTYKLEIAADADFNDADGISIAGAEVEDLNEPEGDIGRWYRMTAAVRFNNPSANQYIRFTAYQYPPDGQHPMGGASMIDQVDIDCRSVSPDFVRTIDFRDYAALAAKVDSNTPAYDLNPDGHIDIGDIAVLCENWLKSDKEQ
ncbi:MAG: hypothetical protein JW804_00530 [Sedimentisphaerales bacterium]|nr:hypothetical protein [Sedimentisphaerales bacterium]